MGHKNKKKPVTANLVTPKTMRGYGKPEWGGQVESATSWNRNGWGDVGGTGIATSLNRRSGDRKAAWRRAARERLDAAAQAREVARVARFGEAARHAPPVLSESAGERWMKCGWCARSYREMGQALAEDAGLCWECRMRPERRMMIRERAASGSAADDQVVKTTTGEVKRLRPQRMNRKVELKTRSAKRTQVIPGPRKGWSAGKVVELTGRQARGFGLI